MNLKKTTSLQWIAVVTLGAFSGQLMGCGGPTDAAGDDVSQREVTVDVQAPSADDGGNVALRSLAQEKVQLGQYPWMNRAFTVDGRTTTDVDAIRTATKILVPLNNGGTLSLHRTGDLYEVTGVDQTQSVEQELALRAFRLRDAGYELYRADNPDNAAPNALVRLDGIDDLAATRGTLAATMAMQSVLATVEEGETIAPAVAIALIAAAVVAAWMIACGGLVALCANRCASYRGFDVKCGGLNVKLRAPRSVSIRFTLSAGCTCVR